ncbi:gamma-glutamyltransferase [bacterium]|nr:gamma-glutamyltransferase [bacterium]
MKLKEYTLSLSICLTLLLSPMILNAAAPAPAWGTKGMVSSAHPLATEVGARVLEEGGNAFDAALATSYVLAVVEGYSAGIGGGEFWVIRDAKTGKMTAIDGRETAPAKAHRDMYIDSTGNTVPGMSTTGIYAGGVPGTVAAREYIRDTYGSFSRKRILEDAIKAAEDGFIVTPNQAEYYAYLAPKLGMFESTKKVMFKNDTLTWEAGDTFVQKDLANTLKRISKYGKDDFYRGDIAKEIVRYMEEQQGLITAEDLANYKINVLDPVMGTYRGYSIYSMPPPSSGGVHLIQILNILEEWDIEQFGRGTADYYHHLAEAMEAAFADRAEYLGDPAFYDVPVEGLINKEYAALLRSAIPDHWARTLEKPGNPFAFMAEDPAENPAAGHTTHLSVIDKWGNMVAVTATINTGFGSGVILGNTGIFLNNEMDDFSVSPGQPNYFGLIGSEANAIAAGKRPLSSMTPTLILKDGQPFMAVGASGGPKIITGTLQTFINVVDFGLDIQKAVSEPRIHHQWKPDYLFIDYDISPECAKVLNQMGHKLYLSTVASGVHGVMIDQESGMFYGGADPRSGGSAAGVK